MHRVSCRADGTFTSATHTTSVNAATRCAPAPAPVGTARAGGATAYAGARARAPEGFTRGPVASPPRRLSAASARAAVDLPPAVTWAAVDLPPAVTWAPDRAPGVLPSAAPVPAAPASPALPRAWVGPPGPARARGLHATASRMKDSTACPHRRCDQHGRTGVNTGRALPRARLGDQRGHAGARTGRYPLRSCTPSNGTRICSRG